MAAAHHGGPRVDPRVYEHLWGMEARLSRAPGVGGLAVVRRPWGFRVFETGPRPLGSPGWRLYLVRAVGLDTRSAAARLTRLLGGSGSSYAGLKEACAVKYQYISIKNPARVGPVEDPGSGLRAWPVGEGRLVPGRHSGNVFRLTVEHGNPQALCEALRGLARIPGYYGPQRFGVDRPNTHYVGLLASLGLEGSLVRELSSRYPLETRREPGGYEGRVLGEVRKTLSPWAPAGRRAWWRGFALQALRAYLFNRALSRAIVRGGVEGYAEHWVEVECPLAGPRRVPAARLPGSYHLGSGSAWAGLVREVAEEEGLKRALRLWRDRTFRPLVYPICGSWCRPAQAGVEAVLALPPGAYATVALWEAADVDWVEYARCG